MNANPFNDRTVLVHYIHTDCHLYYPFPPKCTQIRAEQLPWAPEVNGKAYTSAAISKKAQEHLRDRIQELVVARASAGHAEYPEVVDTGGIKTKICCEVKGVYPKWEGHDSSRGPNLLAEDKTAFGNQLTLMTRRGFIDSLVIEFAFGVGPTPKVQSARAYMCSPADLH